jgi:hypothetical protein
MTGSISVPPPHGAVALFDGNNLEHWVQRRSNEPATWPLEDGAMITQGGDIQTLELFQDFLLHLEFRVPDSPPEVKGQGRGNSGVYLQGRYEIQVLDSWGILEPGQGDCGALYDHAAPLVNACKRPEEWQSYDVVFRAPRFDAQGKLSEQARVTVLQNGLVIQNNVLLSGQTGGAINEDYAEPGPLLLQDHGNRVRFRNVWILPLPLSGADHY